MDTLKIATNISKLSAVGAKIEPSFQYRKNKIKKHTHTQPELNILSENAKFNKKRVKSV